MGRQRFFKCHVLCEVFRILCLQAHPTNIQWIARAVLAIYGELARHLKVLAQSAWRRDHFPLPPPCSNGRTSSLDRNWTWLRMKLDPQTAQSRQRPWSNFIRGSSLTFLHMVFTYMTQGSILGPKESVEWCDQTILIGFLSNPPVCLIHTILWELFKLGFQHKLCALDHIMASELWVKASKAHLHLLVCVWPG